MKPWEHIAALGEDDLEEQMQQIWSAFVSPYPPDRILADASAELLSNRQNVQHERELCEAIADRLTATNHPGGREEDAWTWLAPTPGLWQQHLSLWNTEVLGIDLYTGSTGAALALTQAAPDARKTGIHADGPSGTRPHRARRLR